MSYLYLSLNLLPGNTKLFSVLGMYLKHNRLLAEKPNKNKSIQSAIHGYTFLDRK